MNRLRLFAVTTALALSAPAFAADKAADDKKADPKTGADKDAPKSGGTLSQGDVDRWLAFFDKFVGYIDADQDDCDKMAKDLSALFDANQAMMVKAKAAHAAGKTMPPAAQQHMTDSLKKIGPGMQKCGSNPKIADVLRKIPR